MRFVVNGGHRLSGRLRVQGAKNSILPILAACVLCRGRVVLHNCPALSDVLSAVRILRHLGLSVICDGDELCVTGAPLSSCEVPKSLMHEMRSSVVFLGAILASAGCARVSMPGGCELGPRPIDIHIAALRRLGAVVEDDCGVLNCSVPQGLVGAEIALLFPSVGATENAILAAVLAKGTTVITNAAREPEIVDLARFLNACGAHVGGAGSGTVTVQCDRELHGGEYTIMPDRIAKVTFLTAAAITGGDVTVTGAEKAHITSVLSLLEQSGCEISVCRDTVRLRGAQRPESMAIIKTLPYPGFPTDAQAPLMALASLADGSTMFVETIFENRYRHVCELIRMGADIKTEGRVAVVNGVPRLHGAAVTCGDLRGGAALLLAALAAGGESTIDRIEHIDRGYQQIEVSLSALGADIKRTE